MRLLSAANIWAALRAAGYTTVVTSRRLEDAALVLNDLGQGVVSALRRPSMGDLRITRDAILAVQEECADALATIVPARNLPPGEEPIPESLGTLLTASRDPLIGALLDASRSMAGDVDGTDLAQTLLAMDRLRSWAQAAGEQFEAGLKRERRCRADYFAQSPSWALGIGMIHFYTALTGRKAKFSRPADQPGKPTGPLIRYLDHLFACVRPQLTQEPAYAHLSDRSAWSPTEETFANWIRILRSPEGQTEVDL